MSSAERPRWRLSHRFILWGLCAIVAQAILLEAALTTMTWRLMLGQEQQVLEQRIGTVAAFVSDAIPDEASLFHEIAENATPPREIFLYVSSANLSEPIETPGFGDNMPWIKTSARFDFADGTVYESAGGRSFFVIRRDILLQTAATKEAMVWAASDITMDIQLLHEYLRLTALVTLGAVVLVGTALAVFVRRNLAPIARVTKEVMALSPTDLDRNLTTEGLSEELYLLAEAYNSGIGRLRGTIRSLSTYADNAAHELRGPVGRVLSRVEKMRAAEDLPEETADTLDDLIEEILHLRDLLNQVLFLARAESGLEVAHMAPLSIAEKITRMHEIYQPSAQEAEVRLESRVAPDLVWRVEATFLRQILSNLIENALRHTPPGGQITVSAQEVRGSLHLEVSDTGSGIAAEDLPFIFDRFYQASKARSNSSGVGLGLSLVRALARLMGGAVSVKSAPNQGAVFLVTVPWDK